jgi:hypothetical protein
MMDYDAIKALAKELGCKTTDLIALAPQNDPFYAGTPNDWTLGKWFAKLWERFGYARGVHLRRVHYQVISQDPPIEMPNSKPYENTEACWDLLSASAKAARYLRLVEPGAFVDRRNPEPHIYTAERQDAPAIRIDGNLWSDSLELPSFPELPSYAVTDYIGEQRYHLEIWCEKSTMNDVLLPFCERYGINLVTGVGEMSITATLDAVRRIAARSKPARLLYISDFDPAGQSMPVAIGRKIEYFVRSDALDVDIRLFPVVLTEAQCKLYHLPRTPIKETERRAARFEERYGAGATELDALEALHPGELASILRRIVRAYYDSSLSARVEDARYELQADLDRERQAIIDRYAGELAELEAGYNALRAEFAERMQHYSDRITRLWRAISDEMDAASIDIDDYPIPEASAGDEFGDGLYNSDRDYLEQNEAFKGFQGKIAPTA